MKIIWVRICLIVYVQLEISKIFGKKKINEIVHFVESSSYFKLSNPSWLHFSVF